MRGTLPSQLRTRTATAYVKRKIDTRRRFAISTLSRFDVHLRLMRQEAHMSVQTVVQSSGEFREATRLQTSVLAGVEKRTLVWLAERMPGGVTSDHLTILAFASMLLAGLSYWLARATPAGLVLAVVCLAANWFGDSLDGTLARVRRQPRPRYGFYVDHMVDAFGALFLLGGLALSGYMHPIIAAAVLIAYLLISVETFLATHALATFRMSHFRIGPTELRLILAAGNAALLVHPTAQLFGYSFQLFDVGGAIAAGGLIVTTIIAACRNTCALYRAEPVPERPAR
jgi:archaetidylinositol phosphate synthase